jgi:hypothetical protein
MNVNALVKRLKTLVKPFTPVIDTYEKIIQGSEHYRQEQVLSPETTNRLGEIMIKLIYLAFSVLCVYLSFSKNKGESFLTKLLYGTFAMFFGFFYLIYYVFHYGLNITAL